MVMPSPPWRFCTRAVPGAMAYCTSMTEVTGMTFQSLAGEVAGESCGPSEWVSVAVMAIWRMPSMQRHAHGDQGGAVAIVEVEVIVSGAPALFDLQAQADVEGFFAGAADPEIALARTCSS